MNNTETTMPAMTAQNVSSTEVHLSFNLPEDLFYFKGHFTGAPILAGVVQIKWVIELSKAHFGIKQDYKKLEAIKFNKVLTPGTLTTLKLVYDHPRNKVQYSYESEHGQHSTGRIVFTAYV